jgi:hypothetical protein
MDLPVKKVKIIRRAVKAFRRPPRRARAATAT